MKTQRHEHRHSTAHVAHVIGRSVKSILKKGGSLGTSSLNVSWPIKCI
ncbi:hypothetical protein DSLASN_03360 [Desulfoluna limicola]|uniref:Uncharacterized protein n=1 Tax=Desulfoluna limicola TaxID=2810562 RepID=A0ABN6F0U8_9BACT|nr:hypothetical protein DSLASN_03360 [Desulfoluna limicola]